MYCVELECKKCTEDFEAKDWQFGDEVQCPHCLTWWETDYDEDWDMNISGPWLTNETTNPDVKTTT